jgi:hypothetical protein
VELYGVRIMKLQKTLLVVALLLCCCGALSSCYEDGYPYGSGSINWYVNPDPNFGSDVYGDGSPGFPFQTIGQALRFSIPGDGIILASGTYSVTSGEVFPLLVKSGVSILGDPANKGSTTAVIGGGSYAIQGGTQFVKSVTVTAAFVMGSGSQLSGVKVTASGPSGVGVVFDGNSGSLVSSTLTACGASGVQVFQAATPSLVGNVITTSGAAGVTLFDTSGPNLRQNQILNSSTDGVLANDKSSPNLGDAASAGGNTLQGNTGVGLNNATGVSTIQAVGNTWTVPGIPPADANGHYPPATATVSNPPDYLITAGGAIQF